VRDVNIVDVPLLPSERQGYPAAPDLSARRKGLTDAVAAGLFTVERPPENAALGGVRSLHFRAPGTPRGTILHLHGGGFRIGSPEMVGAFAAAFAARCGVDVICPAYRLAPEYPFPSALADARAVFTALQRDSENPLILSGDSAGGGLVAGLAALAAADMRPPIGLVMLSPWLDLTVTAPAYEANVAADPMFSRGAAEEAAALYLQGVSARDVLASPLFGNVAGFPPSFISVGEGEVLADDGRRFHAALTAAGVRSVLSVIAGMEHVAVTRDLALPGAAETFAAMADFVGGLIGD